MKANVIEQKEARIKTIIRQKASDFFLREGSNSALMTVTRVELLEHGIKAIIFFTVFPVEKEAGALDFAKRKRGDFREYLKQETKLFRLPFVDFNIDLGEKNRQKIDKLSNI